MTCLPLVVRVESMVVAVVRRRRVSSGGLNVPRHLWPDRAALDPEGWRRARFDWARQYPWPVGKIGFLGFFMETRETLLALRKRM